MKFNVRQLDNSRKNMKKIHWLWVTGIAIALLIVVLLLLLLPSKNDLPKEIDSRWQAVFLSDGQVYFGHLENENRRFSRLTDVYYLKYAKELQQDRTGSTQSPSAQNLNLVKLGGEVHGPEDTMFIAKDKILFIEILKDSSTVVQAIKKNAQ